MTLLRSFLVKHCFNLFSTMSFVFDPDSLTSLSLDDTLCGKNVTVDPKIMDGNFLLRPLRSDDYGMLIIWYCYTQIPEYLPLLEQMKSVEKVTQEKFEGEMVLFFLLLQQVYARNIWIVRILILSSSSRTWSPRRLLDVQP